MFEIEEHLREIIDKYSALIRSVISKNLHKTDSVDLVDIEQEVKIKIWTLLKKGKKVEYFASYIRRIAYTVTVDELRKMRKQNPSCESSHLNSLCSLSQVRYRLNYPDSPEIIFEDKELKASVDTLIDSLGKNRKQVLRLYLAGMSIDEICEFSGWDKTKVRHFLYRGIDDLKEIIKSKSTGS